MKLAIVTTHPVQYTAPWIKLLAGSFEHSIKVFYTFSQSKEGLNFDHGFKRKIEWDIPLLEGYEYEFVENISSEPGTDHFKGIQNPGLCKKIEEWKPNALLVIGWNFQSHLYCLRYFHNKIPILFRGDSTLLDEKNNLKKFLRRIFLHWVYTKVDIALYVGKNNKKYFLAHGLKEKQLFHVPHAIDNGRFSNPNVDYQISANLWRESLAIAKDDFVILFAGKLEKKKNPHFIIQLSRQLTDEHFKFIFVGNGELEEELKQFCKNDKRILFIDFKNQREMPVVYRLAQIFILPSMGPGETWGLAINEALASGIPVIATNKVGGAIDLIKSGSNGLIINSEDINGCADFILNLYNNKAAYNEMLNSSNVIIQDFSFERIVAQINQILKKLALQYAQN